MDFLLDSKWLLLSNAEEVWLLRSCPLFIHLSVKKKKKKKPFCLIWFILPSTKWFLEYCWEYFAYQGGVPTRANPTFLNASQKINTTTHHPNIMRTEYKYWWFIVREGTKEEIPGTAGLAPQYPMRLGGLDRWKT